MSTLKISKFKMALLKMKGRNFKNSNSEQLDFNQVKHVTLFYDVRQMQKNQRQIFEFIETLSNQGKTVTSIVLYPTNDPKTIGKTHQTDLISLCLKDFTRYGLPKSEIALKAISAPCDLYIDLNSHFDYTSIGMAMMCKSVYKVSPYYSEYKPYFNILLKHEEDADLNEYLCSITDFFKHLK
jgi:hypothetical protein